MREAAAYFGCHYDTMRRKVSNGSVPTVRVGGMIRIDLDALEAMGSPAPVAKAPRPVGPVADPREPYADFIVKLVDAAPSLTGEQRVRIAAILGGGR